ncbi:MAG: ATP-binding protein [Ruminococcus sp.]|nr:ATP-binding protein [Ruminococcus sp.]
MKENKELLSHIQKEYSKQEANLMRLKASDCDKKSVSDTGSLIFDSIIEDIGKQCLRESIHFTVLCEHFSSPFSKIDTISLFYNILDNAVEACLFVIKDRFIALHVFSERNNICIMCENSKTKKSNPIADNFQTVKADKINHGKGTAVIRDIVEKYDGNVTYTDKSSTLKLSITVPINTAK